MVAKALERLALDLEQLKVDMNDPEIAWRIEQDLTDARGLHVAETPEFFVNGPALPTFSLRQLENLVNEAIKNSYH